MSGEVWLAILLFAVGLGLVIKGGDIFVDAAGWISEVTGIPRFVVGATIVSFATTMPELFVSILATVQGTTDMAVGNAIGSAACNTGLIMGISLLFLPTATTNAPFHQKAILMMAATAFLAVASIDGRIDIWESIVLLLMLALFVYLNLRHMKRDPDSAAVAASAGKPEKEHPPATGRNIAIHIAKFVLGAAAVVVGADLLVDNGSLLAKAMGIPENVIGLTLVAVGTSLPELVTTITAIRKGESTLSVGNIVGANLIDMTLILSVCSFISGGSLEMSRQNLILDLPATLLFMAIGIVPTFFTKKFSHWQGACMLGAYAAYITVVCVVPASFWASFPL